MPGGTVAPNNVDNGFSPWEQWSPEEDVCFHDRIAEGLKDGSLSADGVAAIVLQLLTKANNTALALLKEVRYVDSAWACEINVHALVAAQQHILVARNLLFKGWGAAITAGCPLEPIGGKRLMRFYHRIAVKCYAAVASLNIFYKRVGIWIHGYDKKYFYVAQIQVFLLNVLDAMTQCYAAVCPYKYTILNEGDLDNALSRAGKVLRVSVNALNALSIPEKDAEIVLSEKSVLLINASVLASALKLLDMAARHTFSPYNKNSSAHDLHNQARAIRNCCALRVQVLTAKCGYYMRIAKKNGNIQQALTCKTAIWALDHLHDEVYAISHGTYDSKNRNLCYTTEISIDVAECSTALELLRLAYSRTGRQTSTLAKTLERYDRMVKDAGLLCKCLNPCEQDSVTEWHDMLAYLECARGGLVAIDKSQLIYTTWSSRLLEQAVQAIERAFNACESALRKAESEKGTGYGSSHYYSLHDVLIALRNTLFRAGLLEGMSHIEVDSSTLVALLSHTNGPLSAGDEPMVCGGGYSGSVPCSSTVSPPASYIDNVVEPNAERSIARIERNSSI